MVRRVLCRLKAWSTLRAWGIHWRRVLGRAKPMLRSLESLQSLDVGRRHRVRLVEERSLNMHRAKWETTPAGTLAPVSPPAVPSKPHCKLA